jgi:hypothetical protein
VPILGLVWLKVLWRLVERAVPPLLVGLKLYWLLVLALPALLLLILPPLLRLGQCLLPRGLSVN